MPFDLTTTDYFNLKILPRYRFTFESELTKNGIVFIMNQDTYISEYFRYYLKKSDRELIDTIIVREGIVAHEYSIATVDVDEGSRYYKIYLIAVVIIVLLVLIFGL